MYTRREEILVRREEILLSCLDVYESQRFCMNSGKTAPTARAGDRKGTEAQPPIPVLKADI